MFGEELYDHTLDPGENINLESRPELASIKTYLYMSLVNQFSIL